MPLTSVYEQRVEETLESLRPVVEDWVNRNVDLPSAYDWPVFTKLFDAWRGDHEPETEAAAEAVQSLAYTMYNRGMDVETIAWYHGHLGKEIERSRKFLTEIDDA